MRKNTSVSQTESQQELEQLRAIVLGKDNHLITDTINDQAREIVSKVLAEALHDRQTKDGAINKVLLPIVENSVENSVTHHSDRLVSSLYPLMGSLVRKSVGAFLTDFIEKTNQLIEYSFTIKGLKWRIKAWQAGVSFTHYVISQTYNYRVEHVLLIHQETGLLLKSVNLSQQSKNDADLISSMLTAINDFVGDSFQINKDGSKEQLQTVSTDNFNLLIKPGPNAIIVAAVIGNPPQEVSEQLQITLEDIHRLYMDEFEQFNGDNAPFENTANQLRDSLLTEEKVSEAKSNKKPWFAWLLIIITMALLGFQFHNWYQLEQLSNRIMKIDQEPGIVVQSIEVNNAKDISIDVMRDPDAISIKQWFDSNEFIFSDITLKERRYLSLSPKILERRVASILSNYPNVTTQWQDEHLLLSGNIDLSKLEKLTAQLANSGISRSQLDTNKLLINNSDKFAQTTSINQQVFKELIGKISAIQLDFDIGSNQVTDQMVIDLQKLTAQFLYLKKLAKHLNINVALLIMGSSDNSGNRNANNKLSTTRAKSTAAALIKLGVSKEQMFVTGLGQIDIKDVKYTSRKVMFNIMYVDNIPKVFNKSRDDT
jgi:outer membrane protein OmpA-like peptidoglycan-associated protein